MVNRSHMTDSDDCAEACGGSRLYLASLMASQMASLARACSSRAEGISEQPLARACACQHCEHQHILARSAVQGHTML